jgi:hypothetical protein
MSVLNNLLLTILRDSKIIYVNWTGPFLFLSPTNLITFAGTQSIEGKTHDSKSDLRTKIH